MSTNCNTHLPHFLQSITPAVSRALEPTTVLLVTGGTGYQGTEAEIEFYANLKLTLYLATMQRSQYMLLAIIIIGALALLKTTVAAQSPYTSFVSFASGDCSGSAYAFTSRLFGACDGAGNIDTCNASVVVSETCSNYLECSGSCSSSVFTVGSCISGSSSNAQSNSGNFLCSSTLPALKGDYVLALVGSTVLLTR